MNAMKLTKEEILEGITCEVERGKWKLTQKLKRKKEMGGG
jgi:hypothetical protein